MVKVDCASLPPTLIESELFGREKGAYTGALTRQIGRVETLMVPPFFSMRSGSLGRTYKRSSCGLCRTASLNDWEQQKQFTSTSESSPPRTAILQNG